MTNRHNEARLGRGGPTAWSASRADGRRHWIESLASATCLGCYAEPRAVFRHLD
jgi:hypothetical protein